jgi:hypothetical protein
VRTAPRPTGLASTISWVFKRLSKYAVVLLMMAFLIVVNAFSSFDQCHLSRIREDVWQLWKIRVWTCYNEAKPKKLWRIQFHFAQSHTFHYWLWHLLPPFSLEPRSVLILIYISNQLKPTRICNIYKKSN